MPLKIKCEDDGVSVVETDLGATLIAVSPKDYFSSINTGKWSI